MIVIGLTGGIGSGKTTVANFFSELNVPVYIADDEAKQLMVRSKVIKRNLIALFGDEAYVNKELNKPFIASKIFSDTDYLQKMNVIVHPKVALHFKRWLKKQNSPYVIKEAAIIFEHNKEALYDFVIIVTSNLEDRINRVIIRDNSSKSKIEFIIKNQMSDEEKIKKSHFVITNDNLEDTKNQVGKMHQSILEQIKKLKN
ncbi:MAG: dephospho-CoA kinase [Psychroserpens sp.]|jgi:dephospho-CoA kinase